MAMYDAGGCKIKSGRGGAIPEGEMDALLLGRTKELVAATPSQRNYKGILISLLVICGVCGLIVFSIYLLKPPDEGPRVKGRNVQISDIISSKFEISSFNGSWVADNELVFRDYLGGLSLLNVESFHYRPFIANTTFRQLNAKKFSVSRDKRFVLFEHEEQHDWARFHLAKYTVYNIENEFRNPLNPSDSNGLEDEQEHLQHAEWGPIGNSLIFIHDNDIYYKVLENSNQTIRITDSGVVGSIYNGIPDLLYRDILDTSVALWVSPDGRYLLYATFNDTIVGEYSYSWYGSQQVYSTPRVLKYPKAGTNLPVVTLWVVNLEDSTFTSIPLQFSFDVRNSYLTGAAWSNQENVVIVWMNRFQNTSIITKCQASPTWDCSEIYRVKKDSQGWLDFVDPPLFPTEQTCLLRIPWRDGEAGYFKHVVWLDTVTRKEIPITHGSFEVTKIVARDKHEYIYFLAAPKGAPGQRHLYRISEKASNSTVIAAAVCMTCASSSIDHDNWEYKPVENTKIKGNRNLSMLRPYLETSFEHVTEEDINTLILSSSTDDMVDTDNNVNGSEGTTDRNNDSEEKQTRVTKVRLPPCLYNNVIFSPSNRYFIRECLGPNVPMITLHQAPSGRLLSILDNRTSLQDELSKLAVPIIRTFRVETNDGYRAPVRLFLPPGLREDEEFKFPLILHVNGAPGSQLVSEKWKLTWSAHLASQNHFIVAEVDGRGTGFQGDSLRHSVHKKLGTKEVMDQIEVIRYLAENVHFIDAENIGVWGHGFGGYLSALILAHDKDKVFRCGISVAPMVNWEFYNAGFSERYMGLPNLTDNYAGYENAEVTRVVDKLKNRKFLIIHGTADDDVHFQHTAYLTKALIQAGVTFTEQIYPDEGHDFTNVKHHMYSTMEAFFIDSFDTLDFEDWEKVTFLGIKL